jgi:serine/threonine protein kinase/tetratricopeptide (TPR) repeat protein
MTMTDDHNQGRSFKEAVRQFIEAQLQGKEPDIEEFVSQYPEFEQQIRQKIKKFRKIDSLFDSLVQANDDSVTDTATGRELVSQKIGSFEIVEIIGLGGMGVVYHARDTKLDRSVAIKSIPADLQADPNARMRFRREAKLLASLNHPNIAVIHEIIEQDQGADYLILEYVPGQTLAERIAREPLKLEQAITIGQQIAEAISAAHKKGVTHRDLKPGNIKITPEGKVKVLDFGLAKVVSGAALDRQSTITQPGRIIGTPAYMSPEQARGKAVDHRTDIWSFGCIMYEILTGHLPFEGETATDTLAYIIEREPNWDILPERIPTDIRILLSNCLEKEPHRRLHDMGDIAVTLKDTATKLQNSALPMESTEADHIQSMAVLRRALPWLVTVVVGALVVILGFIIVLKFGELPKERQGKSISESAVTPIKTIVVLPFENLSGDPNQEYFVNGMTDALSAELGKLKALRVISRTSSMRYKNTDKDILTIAKELGVDAVIEGSVLKAGDDVRITAQLVDGRIDTHLWSENYTGNLTNILALQSEVTFAIAREIEIAITPEEERRITRRERVKPEAYEAYLKGIFFMEKHTEDGFRTAAMHFYQAIEIEPDYAEAHAWLGGAYWVPSIWGYAAPYESFSKGKIAMNTAYELDETCAESLGGIGWIALYYDWDWKKAKESLEGAIKLNSNYTYGYHGLAWYWVMAGRFDNAVDTIQKALKLDPHSHVLHSSLACMYWYSGQRDEGLKQNHKALELVPGFVTALADRAEYYLSMSMYQEAVESIRKAMDIAGRTPGLLAILGRAYALSDKKSEAETLLRELQENDRDEYISPIYFAALYASLDDTDEAFRWLHKAYEERNPTMPFLRTTLSLEPLHSDPRFDKLIKQMNFPQ